MSPQISVSVDSAILRMTQMSLTRRSNREAKALNRRNMEIKARNRERIVGVLRDAPLAGYSVVEIQKELVKRKTKIRDRHPIYEHLERLEKERQVYPGDDGKWHYGAPPEKPSIQGESLVGHDIREQLLDRHDFPDLKFLVEALGSRKFCRFFRRTFNPQGVEPEDLAEAEAEVDPEKRREIESDIADTVLSRIEAKESASKDVTGQRIGSMFVVADSEWDRAKGNPINALKDMFLVKTPYFLDKVIAAAVRAKVLSTQRFTEKGELRTISDRDLERLREWAFGGIGKFIVLFSIYPEVLFNWLKRTREGKEALFEASKSVEVKAEVEKVRRYGKAGKKLSEMLKREDERRRRRRSGE